MWRIRRGLEQGGEASREVLSRISGQDDCVGEGSNGGWRGTVRIGQGRRIESGTRGGEVFPTPHIMLNPANRFVLIRGGTVEVSWHRGI